VTSGPSDEDVAAFKAHVRRQSERAGASTERSTPVARVRDNTASVKNFNSQDYSVGSSFPTSRNPQMGFRQSVISCFRQYISASGRATRAEYWWFFLFTALVYVVILGIGLLGVMAGGASWADLSITLVVISSFILLPPTISVLIRRLHDAGHSGWWWLLTFVPVGGIVLLVIVLQPSKVLPQKLKAEPSPPPQTGAVRAKRRFCIECGRELEGDNPKFCANCGASTK
jgi:uncharacterized membrane protein YhaH (DUF805 family)